MTTRYILDTNILSDLIHEGEQSTALRRIVAVGENSVATSIVVAAEIRYGVQKKGSERLRRAAERVLGTVRVLRLEQPVDEIYGRLRTHLEQQGQSIGPNDLLIASHCLALGCALVTDNGRAYRRVPDLVVENWIIEG